MKKNIVMLGVMLIATLLTACSTQTYVVRGQYDIANSVTTTTPYDQVWNSHLCHIPEAVCAGGYYL